MPICRNCKKRIDRFSKDRCPRCGIEHPFEGMSSDTVEITTNIDTDAFNNDYHPCKKKQLLILFLTLGFTGIPFFYIHKKNLGFLHLLANLSVFAAIAVLFILVVNLHVALGILIGLGVIYLINICFGLYFYYQPNLKDGNGEFLI